MVLNLVDMAFVIVQARFVVVAVLADMADFLVDIKRVIERFILSFVSQIAINFKVYCWTLMANTNCCFWLVFFELKNLGGRLIDCNFIIIFFPVID